MKSLLISVLSIVPGLAWSASGHDQGGGGSGCLAEFMRSAYQTTEYLQGNGEKLRPVVRADQFSAAIDPSTIRFTDADLRYHGNPVDAYYDGSRILVRCDRFLKNEPITRQRVVAHEFFRKMKLEGDAYEISSQIWDDEDVFIEKVYASPVCEYKDLEIVQIAHTYNKIATCTSNCGRTDVETAKEYLGLMLQSDAITEATKAYKRDPSTPRKLLAVVRKFCAETMEERRSPRAKMPEGGSPTTPPRGWIQF